MQIFNGQTKYVDRYVSRPVTPYNDYSITCQEVDEEETIKHIYANARLCMRKVSLLSVEGFLTMFRRLHRIQLFVLMNFIRSTGWFREETIEEGDFKPDDIMTSLLKT